MKSLASIIYFTSHQKILQFLLSHPDEKFYDRQISHLASVSRAGSNFALRDLAEAGLILREQQGRMNYYHISLEQPLVREMKVVMNLIALSELVEKLKRFSRKIILFGSAARGQNTSKSDYDILIIAHDKPQVNAVIMTSPLREKLQPVIASQNDYAKIKANEPVFYREVQNGRVLWESSNES
jgi:predicted nucleotidyltransferase